MTTPTTPTTESRTIRPLNDRVLVRRVEADDRSPGGILYIPQGAKEKPTEGVVVAVGPGAYGVTEGGCPQRRPMAVNIGDRGVFGKYAGTDVNVAGSGAGEDYVLLKEDEIFAVLE